MENMTPIRGTHAANALRAKPEGQWRLPLDLRGTSGGAECANTPPRLTTSKSVEETCIMAISIVSPGVSARRCAYCGGKGQSLMGFPLLAEACRDQNVPLKAGASDGFHPRCARSAFAKVMRKIGRTA